MDRRHDVTRLLNAWGRGERAALDALLPLVYEDLARVARAHLRRKGRTPTLDTQAVVHECYLKLVDAEGGSWADRVHFYAVASKAMRHILVDHARRARAQKRGGGQRAVTLDESALGRAERIDELIALEEALTRLAERDPGLVDVVECRFFGGLTVEETAAALGMSRRTVERTWTRARAYLQRELSV